MRLTSPLLTDLYQLTMAQAYWQHGHTEQEAVFHLFFRNHSFKGNYTVSCGLAHVIDYLQNYQFHVDDLDYLRTLKTPKGRQRFSNEFLNYLQGLQFNCTIDAIEEGTLVFPQEPMLRVRGPILQCQLLETPLLNLINYASLIATKAARICQIAAGDPVIEFGLRRAHGPCGGVMASRAAYLGGCESTSNVLAGQVYNIPVKGTVAHSWIMSYSDELQAFRDFVNTYPDMSILLVDTFDTLQGVKNAIIVGKELREQGHDLMGIRLDSGNLLELSRKSRQLLDKEGFKNTKITASSDLDEYVIADLKANRAPIDQWGVGTRLSTAFEEPALNGVYKIAALRNPGQSWQYKLKISDDPSKSTLPGIHQVRRYFQQDAFVGDVLYDQDLGIQPALINNADHYQDLLTPIFQSGKLIYQQPPIHISRQYCLSQVRDFLNSTIHDYPLAIEPKLLQLKQQVLEQVK